MRALKFSLPSPASQTALCSSWQAGTPSGMHSKVENLFTSHKSGMCEGAMPRHRARDDSLPPRKIHQAWFATKAQVLARK